MTSHFFNTTSRMAPGNRRKRNGKGTPNSLPPFVKFYVRKKSCVPRDALNCLDTVTVRQLQHGCIHRHWCSILCYKFLRVTGKSISRKALSAAQSRDSSLILLGSLVPISEGVRIQAILVQNGPLL